MRMWAQKCIGYFLQIAPKMRFNSLVSRHSARASEAKPVSAVAIIRRKNMVSRDSLRQVPIRCLKSFPDTELSASQKFAPTLVPAPTSWSISRVLTGFRGTFCAKRTMASPNCAVRSSRFLTEGLAGGASSRSTPAPARESSPHVQNSEACPGTTPVASDSDFGIRISFGFRASDFGLSLRYFILLPRRRTGTPAGTNHSGCTSASQSRGGNTPSWGWHPPDNAGRKSCSRCSCP
jgi:hypothetical protein